MQVMILVDQLTVMLPLMSAFTGENAVALSMSMANNPCYSTSKFHQEQRVAIYVRYNLVGIKVGEHIARGGSRIS